MKYKETKESSSKIEECLRLIEERFIIEAIKTDSERAKALSKWNLHLRKHWYDHSEHYANVFKHKVIS